MLHTAFLCLGSNLGDRLVALNRALELLPPEASLIRSSSIYETEPWGFTDQPAFLNQVIEVETESTPLQLMKYLKKIEKKIGRTPSFRYGPRAIDMDILFYDDIILNTPRLHIPHPRLSERAFALVPLAEIAPNAVHPELGMKVTDLLVKLDRSGIKLLKTAAKTGRTDHGKMLATAKSEKNEKR